MISILVITLLATITYFVDPYGLYHYSRINYNKNRHLNSDPYMFKTYHVKWYQPEAIVLGTSRAMRLDPVTIKSLTGQEAYNLGLPAATTEIMYHYLKHSISVNKQIKTVYVGLDFEVFESGYLNHANYKEERLTSMYFKDYIATLSSKNALVDSYNVVKDNIYHTNRYTENRYLSDGSFDETFVYSLGNDEATIDMLPISFELSNTSMMYIKKIKEICEQNRISLYVYISPVHAKILEFFWEHGLWEEYESWKKQLTEIIPIWDFSGFNEISTSAFNKGEFYNDLSHFSKKVGNFILYKMLDVENDEVPNFFGTLLNSDMIDEHLENMRFSRELGYIAVE
ncbi:hypothetical protein ACX1C1_14080 [Paenibacillus sp. strain BS8-2]